MEQTVLPIQIQMFERILIRNCCDPSEFQMSTTYQISNIDTLQTHKFDFNFKFHF